jgi:hypothetical protein
VCAPFAKKLGNRNVGVIDLEKKRFGALLAPPIHALETR